MKLRIYFLWAAALGITLALAYYRLPTRHRGASADTVLAPAFWQHSVLPGALSQPHAFLENNCAACHTAVKGVEAKNCIVCHADNVAVLKRQPSAFHGDIGECVSCHGEHQGRVAANTKMDHDALAGIGVRQIQNTNPKHDSTRDALVAWLKQADGVPLNPQLQPAEALLNCASCHQTKDRHQGFFGNDCAKCHVTAQWTLPDFRHPSSASQSCVQCHQAPPSHYMMHFQMISMGVAHMKKAEVSQCFLCHQTTSWNDIKGVGFYKHH